MVGAADGLPAPRGVTHHCVVALRKTGRAGVVGLARELDAPPAVGPDMAPDGDGRPR